MVEYLHEALTMGFKVKLKGEGFPKEFRDGDVLDLLNLTPEEGNFVLLKRRGKYGIEKFHENSRHRSLDNVLGTIESVTRSVGEFDLFLGEGEEVVPALCAGCDQIEVIETAGHVGAYCWTKLGLKGVPMGLKRCVCKSKISRQGER